MPVPTQSPLRTSATAPSTSAPRLESFNLAAAWRLPLCFFVENNRYAVSTSVEEATGEPRLSARGPGFGIPSYQVDGMNVLATYLATNAALERMRSGEGPTLIEAEVYRYFHQNGAFPGSAFGYRSKEEEQAWRERDPLRQLSSQLSRRSIFSEQALHEIARAGEGPDAEIGSVLLEPVPAGKPGQRRIKPERMAGPRLCERRGPRGPARVRRRPPGRSRRLRREADRRRSSSTPCQA